MTLRVGIFLVGGTVLATGLLVGVVALPPVATADGPYAQAVTDLSIGQRALNTVAGVLFDLRALDTLGEALALFAAAAGLQLALRGLPGEERRPEPRRSVPGREVPRTSDAVRAVALAVVPLVATLAVIVTVRSHVGIGGGLQGGGLGLATLATVFLAGHYRAQRRLVPDWHLDLEEAIGVGGYVLLGLLGVVLAGAFLSNVLPVGAPGALLSAGLVSVLSVLAAVEARAALLVIATEVQEEPFEREGAT